MNYNKIYTSIIEYRKQNIPEGYAEKHHIIPKSLGGSDDKANLVQLTAREHFICHLLLTKMCVNTGDYFKMIRAFLMMMVQNKNHERFITSRLYEKIKQENRKLISENQRGSRNSQFGSIWISNPNTGESKKSDQGTIPDGWVKGRNRKFQDCIYCGSQFLKRSKTKTCSKSCEQKLKSSLKQKFWKSIQDQ